MCMAGKSDSPTKDTDQAAAITGITGISAALRKYQNAWPDNFPKYLLVHQIASKWDALPDDSQTLIRANAGRFLDQLEDLPDLHEIGSTLLSSFRCQASGEVGLFVYPQDHAFSAFLTTNRRTPGHRSLHDYLVKAIGLHLLDSLLVAARESVAIRTKHDFRLREMVDRLVGFAEAENEAALSGSFLLVYCGSAPRETPCHELLQVNKLFHTRHALCIQRVNSALVKLSCETFKPQFQPCPDFSILEQALFFDEQPAGLEQAELTLAFLHGSGVEILTPTPKHIGEGLPTDCPEEFEDLVQAVTPPESESNRSADLSSELLLQELRSDKQVALYEATSETEPRTGPQICKLAGHKYNSESRDDFIRWVEAGILRKVPRGYLRVVLEKLR